MSHFLIELHVDPKMTSPSFLLLTLTQIRPSVLPDLSETSIVGLLASLLEINSPSSWFRRLLGTVLSSVALAEFMSNPDLADCTWASRLVGPASGHGSVLESVRGSSPPHLLQPSCDSPPPRSSPPPQ